jgi:capsular exopolysaccharide synthesis family protein
MDDKLEKLTAALAPVRPPKATLPAAAPALLELPEATGGVSLRDFWRLLQARRAIVTTTILAALVSAGIYNYSKTPTYLATASIQIDREQPNIARLDEELSRLPERPDYIETQYKILKSRTLARRVIERLDLAGAPELSRAIASSSAASPAAIRLVASGDPAPAHSRLVDAFLARLRVDPGKGTRLVDVSFESEDPKLAPAVANTLADEYIEHNLEAKWNATQKASVWLQQQLTSLQQALESSESALHDYAARHAILFVEERKDITTEKLARLENELTAAQAERIDKQSLALLVEGTVRGGAELPAQVTNAALEDLRTKRASLRGELQKLLVSFGPTYPRVVRVERELEEIARSIEAENQRLLARVREEFELAQGREKLLLDAARQQRGLVNRLSDDFIQYDILKREAESNRQLYEGLLQRLKEAGVSAGLRASNIAVLDPAEIPEHAYRPRRLLNLLFALLSGTVLGVVLAFGAEHLNTRVRTPDEVERLTGLDLLAVLPRRNLLRGNLRARLRIARGAVSVSLERPRQPGAVLGPLTETGNGAGRGGGSSTASAEPAAAGPARQGGASLVPLRDAASPGRPAAPRVWDAEAGLSEAYRTLRSSILLGWEGGLRRLLITSSQPQEGKTTVSLNLACSLAQLGRKVLLIDADMRRPNCARQLGVDARHGLSAYLRGTVEFDALLAATPVDHLSLIHAGSSEAFASDLLCSPRLAELLDEAARRFDHVIIDSPPSLVLSDARAISRFVEGVILVVSDETDRGALLRTKQTLDDAGVRLVGFVMNRVNLADLDYGYYRHYGYYYACGEKQNA